MNKARWAGLLCLLAAALLLLAGALFSMPSLALLALLPLAVAAYTMMAGTHMPQQPAPKVPLRQALLDTWLRGGVPGEDEARAALAAACIHVTAQSRALAQELSIDRYEELLAEHGIGHLREIQQALLSACETAYPNALCSCTREDNVLIIRFVEALLPIQEAGETVQAIRQQMEADYGISFTMGIGSYMTSLAQLDESARNAFFAMRYRMIFGYGQTIAYDQIQMRVGISPPHNREHEQGVVDAFKKGDAVKLEMRLSEYYEAVCAQSASFVPVATMHLFMLLYMSMPPLRQEESDFIGTYSRFRRATYYVEQMRILRDYAVTNMAVAATDGNVPDTQALARVKAYVQENLGNPDLGLVTISENTGLSKNTIRQLLKEQLGTTPRDLISDMRMQRAMELLASSSLTAKAIGEAVGYRESRYFYNVFKKCTGMTAYEYRTQSQRTGK